MPVERLQLSSVLAQVLAKPSVTTWTRLEPSTRDASLTRSLQTQVRDPLWMLARQWQVGEFLGADAGSPANASFAGQTQNVTTWFPGTDPSTAVALDPVLPLEAHVERETVALKLRGSVQLGYYFESLVNQALGPGAVAVITAFRKAFPIAATAPDPTYTPVAAQRFRALQAGRVTDGEALYISAAAAAAGQTPPVPLPPEASVTGMPAVISAFIAYRASLFTEPNNDYAWQSEELQYEFGVGSPTADNNLILNAPDFAGGHLDWYSFSFETAPPTTVSTANPATVTPVAFDFLPNHVTFPGVHDPRWWVFEDSVTDFGALDAQHVDLAKLLVMEFALVYGNDWFSVPVPTSFGNLVSVQTLVVTDTFGQRTLIRPSEDTTVTAGETPWTMYKLSSAQQPGARSNFIMLAPTLGLVEDAVALEDVMFLRDDMAAMAWAVEQHLQGDLDAAINAQEAYLDRLQRNPPAPPPPATPGGPQIYYTLAVPVPDNWIPLVPQQTASGALYLRRGTMEIPTVDGILKVVPRALVLNPGKPFFVQDHVVPRAGVQTDRYFRRARAIDGSTVLWMARKSGPGQGPAWSGLQFDVVRPLKAG